MVGNFFACKYRMAAWISQMAVTPMTGSYADGCQAGTDRRRRAIVVGVGGEGTSKQGGVTRLRLVSRAT